MAADQASTVRPTLPVPLDPFLPLPSSLRSSRGLVGRVVWRKAKEMAGGEGVPLIGWLDCAPLIGEFLMAAAAVGSLLR
jgi:hypothetical protein